MHKVIHCMHVYIHAFNTFVCIYISHTEIMKSWHEAVLCMAYDAALVSIYCTPHK